MNTNEAKIFAAQLGADVPLVDLHGLYPREAEEKLEQFIFANYQVKQKTVRVVYGLGTGKLGEEILAYLQKHPLVELSVEENGSCIVIMI